MPLYLNSIAAKVSSEEILAKIQELEQEAIAIFTPPFVLSEAIALFETICNIVKEVPGITKTELHDALLEAFNYFDEKYSVITTLDNLISLPQPLELFDGPAIGLAIKSGIIPILVGLTKLPE